MSHARNTVVLLVASLMPAASAQPVGPDPVFQSPVTYPLEAGAFPLSVAAGDVNGDGAPELLAAHTSGDLSVLTNLGDGRFGPVETLAMPGTAVGVALGDIDDDDDLDVLVALRDGEGLVAVLRNTGGTLEAPVVLGPPRLAFDLVVRDLEEDGDVDIAVVHGLLDVTVSVLLNTGGGSFAPPVDYFALSSDIAYQADLALVDVTLDGALDLVVVHDCPIDCEAVAVLLAQIDDGVFAAPIPLDLGAAHPSAITAGDVNGDAAPDAVVTDCTFPDVRLIVSVHDGEGTLVPAADLPAPGGCDSFTVPETVCIADLNGDSLPDLVERSRLDQWVRVHVNQGAGTFAPAITAEAGGSPLATIVVDVDGDGRLDAVATIDGPVGEPDAIAVLINDTPDPPGDCPGDLNGDLEVDVDDLVALILSWGECIDCAADLDEDGRVDVEDLVALILAWGGCA